ncbi:MAG TPA: hypothetical protein VNA69_00580 [Thermoanaerobaculia bacterium]|nr:hypothetical protein [Thermoanaerobaculia bacterium]
MLAAALIAAFVSLVIDTRNRRQLEDEVATLRANLVARDVAIENLKTQLFQRTSRDEPSVHPPVNTTSTVFQNREIAPKSDNTVERTLPQPAASYSPPSVAAPPTQAAITPTAALAEAVAVLSGESIGIKASAIGCAHRAGDIVCEFDVLSPKEDRDFTLAASIHVVRSRMIDDQGIEHIAGDAIIGRQESYSAYTTLPAGVAVRAGLRFAGVASTVSQVKLLEIGFVSNRNVGLVRLKQLPISD